MRTSHSDQVDEYIAELEAEVKRLRAKIEAALSWVKPHPRPVSDAQTIDRMVEALMGGRKP